MGNPWKNWVYVKLSTDEGIEAACVAREPCCAALKLDPFGSACKFMSADEERLSMRIVAAVRDAVGDSVDLMIEAHDRFNLSQAIRLGHVPEEYRPSGTRRRCCPTSFEEGWEKRKGN